MSSAQHVFRRLRPICVPLLEASLLSPPSIPYVLKLLADLLNLLRDLKASQFVLTPSLISYTFFPLSTILRRNTSSDIPDQLLERIFLVLAILCEDWWQDCDLVVWEQIFGLAGAVIGGIEGKGKGKDRDEETKEAAARLLLSLLRPRTKDSDARATETLIRLDVLKTFVQSAKFVPILGQAIDAVLRTVDSPSLCFQRASLELLSLFIGEYAPDDLIPTILPGVVSTMTKVSLGTSQNKGWANGDIVAGTLKVMQLAIVRAIGDDICMKEGAIDQVVDLEDLVRLPGDITQTSENSAPPILRPYATARTSSWLRGTASQLLIAINTLAPLVSHSTPSALLALSAFSTEILRATPSTLPQVEPLLLHFLLSLSNSLFQSVSADARRSLLLLLTEPSKAQYPLQQSLLHTATDNLSALPRLLLTQADARIEHVTGLIEAVCRLAVTGSDAKTGLFSISSGIGKLFGPTGGVEKWGWNLLYVLEFVEPAVTVLPASSAQLMLENDPHAPQRFPFPELSFKNVSSNTARDALSRMFRSLGRASGDACLFSVEWFANAGRNGRGPRSVAATWCACRLLEGVAGISLFEGMTGDPIAQRSTRRLTKLARSLARSIAELWDDFNESDDRSTTNNMEQVGEDSDSNILIQHIRGMMNVHETLRITRPSLVKEKPEIQQPLLHQVLSLHLLAISAGVLQSRFSSLFLYALYPILKSLVSSESYLSSTAFATLHFVSTVTSYASPANLLLSNFDYALDAISRRLTRRWLDLEATKVLALMIRLVGSSMVDRAGDVVEECFDRLDEFHGYTVLVEGLVQVLVEVVVIFKEDAKEDARHKSAEAEDSKAGDVFRTMDDYFHWLAHRHDPPVTEGDNMDYGPAPRQAWGPGKNQDAQDGEVESDPQFTNTNEESPPTPAQALTKQIVSRSLYFLTHKSPIIRARILSLLGSSASVLPESAFLPSLHSAWPFIINRFSDPEFSVASAAAGLVEALVTHFGSFMFRRVWDDVWPRFHKILRDLEAADATNALARRGYGAVGTESAYTHSHRVYKSLIRTMAAAVKDVHPHDASIWQVLLDYRRFLHKGAHLELQECARQLYIAVGEINADAVWLVLSSTMDDKHSEMKFLRTAKWDIKDNVILVFRAIGI